MISTLTYNLKIAGESIMQNKLRAILTSLGIIFGVASVISMLAIGKGAEQEILEKMKLLGTNNIIIQPLSQKKMDEKLKEEEDDSQVSDKKESSKKKFTPGLSLNDAKAIKDIIPNVLYVSSEINIETEALNKDLKRNIKLIGIESPFFKINNFAITDGSNFTKIHYESARPVCIIGNNIKTKLFPTENPIGKYIKIGDQWLTIVGVVGEQFISKDNIQLLNLRDFNNDVYIPINTMLMRFVNRSLITKKDLQRRSNRNRQNEEINTNQLDKITVHFANNNKISKSAEIINRLMSRRHNYVQDFEIIVPESLLAQEQSTKRIFNLVLGAIASISLIVGGIGIMNIMLASVLERTKEIGIRKAIGAKKTDILLQFLSEAVAISLTGGIIGIVLGVSASYIIEQFTEIKTIVSIYSVLLSFLVSISIGLIFGITPARKASLEDPINLLRYE